MEGEQPHLRDLLTMVINHLLTGMIIQVSLAGSPWAFCTHPSYGQASFRRISLMPRVHPYHKDFPYPKGLSLSQGFPLSQGFTLITRISLIPRVHPYRKDFPYPRVYPYHKGFPYPKGYPLVCATWTWTEKAAKNKLRRISQQIKLEQP